jgi:nickel-dependent lactate racemase
MQPVAMPFGHGAVDVELEADLLLPRLERPVADETAAVCEALEHPIGTPPLAGIVRPGEKVVVIVNDHTRLARTDLTLPPIVTALNRAGVPDAGILVVFALGNHRRPTDEERKRILGEDMFRRLPTLDHDSRDEANLVAVGKTGFGNLVRINRQVWEADRIILTGEIIYHQIAGYSGGRKSLLPGVAGFQTIAFNHRMVLDPGCRSGALDGNPAHQDMLEACRFVEPDFLVNVVPTPSGELARAVAGHYELAHREGCRAVDSVLGISLEAPYDLVVASAGGQPLDIDLRQAHKGLENACRALRPGGSMLFFAECPNGSGVASLDEFLWRYDSPLAMERALREDFVVGGHKALWLARLGREYDIHLVSTLDPALAGRCGFQHVTPADHARRLAELLDRLPASARVAAIPRGGFTFPRVGHAWR